MNSESSLISINDSNFRIHVASSIEPVVVIFEKSFWGLAHVMRTILEKLSVKYKGKVKFYKYNLDKDSEISNYYQVEDTTTVLFFKDGELVTRTGVKSSEELDEILMVMTDQ